MSAALGARAAAALAAALGSPGARPRRVIVSPGSRSTALALAFAARADCRVHVVLDERAAAFVALGAARATGEPAVLLCTSGSAGAHYLPAVVEADRGRVPLVAITADRPADLHHCGAPQTVPQARLLGDHARLTVDLPLPSPEVDPRWLRNVAARALAAALGSPPGPVHFNAPFREPLWSPGADERPGGLAPVPVTRGRLALDPGQVARLAGELRAQPRGLIAAGPLAPATLDPAELADALGALAARLGWPLLADPLSGLRYGPHDRRAVIGSYDALLRHAPFAARSRPSLVLRFGQLPTSKVASRWLAAHPSWQVDPDGQWHDGGGAAERLLVADPAALCRALAAELGRPAADGAWLAGWRRADRAAAAALRDRCGAPGWGGAVLGGLVSRLPDGAQLVAAGSLAVRDLDSFGPGGARRLAVIANRGVNGIDGTVATALGAALARPGRPTVAVVGDLALLHDLDGLEAAAQLGADLTVVVVDNGGGGIFDHLPIAAHPRRFERLFVTPQRVDIAALCRALSVAHQRAAPGAELELPAGGGGVRVVEVPVERARDLAERGRAWAASARALDAALAEPAPRAEPVGAARGA